MNEPRYELRYINKRQLMQRIEELEAEIASLRTQVAERDTVVRSLSASLGLVHAPEITPGSLAAIVVKAVSDLRTQVETLTRERDGLRAEVEQRPYSQWPVWMRELQERAEAAESERNTLNGWKEGALIGTAEMRKEVAFWRDRAEQAERELAEARREAHQELWRVTDIHRARFRRYRRMVAYKVKAAEAKLDKLVEWRRARSDTWHAPEGWRVVHEMRVRYAGPITYEHPKGAACTAIYPDGTTECDWLEAHKGEQGK